MVSSVSGINLNSAKAMDKASSELMQSPGVFAGPDAAASSKAQAPKKKGGFFRFIGKALLWAAVIGGSLLAAKKWIPQIKNAKAFKELAPDAKLTEKVYSKIAQAADWVDAKVAKKAMALFGNKGQDNADKVYKLTQNRLKIKTQTIPKEVLNKIG